MSRRRGPVAYLAHREATIPDEPFDVVHACNPPDLLFLVALALRPTGARFLFRPPRFGPGVV